MKTTDRPDLATALLDRALGRDRAGYVSAGTAVAQIKALTLCLRADWYRRQVQSGALSGKYEREEDDSSKLKLLLGIGMNKALFGDGPERRVEIPTPFGLLSGRIDVVEESAVIAVPVPGEAKLTWSKAKEGSSTLEPQYREQVAGYALALGSTVGRLIIVHAAGQGGWKVSPVIFVKEIEFGSEELMGFYDELVDRTRQVLGPTPPSMSTAYTWECSYCQFSQKRGGPCEAKGSRKTGYFVEDVDLTAMLEASIEAVNQAKGKA